MPARVVDVSTARSRPDRSGGAGFSVTSGRSEGRAHGRDQPLVRRLDLDLARRLVGRGQADDGGAGPKLRGQSVRPLDGADTASALIVGQVVQELVVQAAVKAVQI